MALKLANMVSSRLAEGINVNSSSIQVVQGDGAKFPDLDPGDWFPIAVVNDLAQVEFMRCIGRTGDLLTVQRAQEGSIARAYAAGDVVELRLTVSALEELRDLGAST